MFKVNNKDTRTTPVGLVSFFNFEHISHLVLVFLLLTLNMQMPAGLFVGIVFMFSQRWCKLNKAKEMSFSSDKRRGSHKVFLAKITQYSQHKTPVLSNIFLLKEIPT